MKKLILIALLFTAGFNYAQQTMTIESCYQLLESNYPLAKQSEILLHQNKLDLESIKTAKLPQMDLAAQATYQSDVIGVPVPGIELPNKDQYRATFTINQLIYDGGSINARMDRKEAGLMAQQKQVEVNLYQLKKRINQVYFSILLVRKQQELISARTKQLDVQLEEIRSGIKNGTVLPSSDKVLQAEILSLRRQASEAAYNEASLFQTLSSLIRQPIDPSSTLVIPQSAIDTSALIRRPELDLFDLKNLETEKAQILLSKQNSPKFLGFATGGYGNPGLNALDNTFQPFYTAGLKLNWHVFDWNANARQRMSLALNKELIETEREAFELNTSIEMQQQLSEMQKLQEFMEQDAESIALRKEVVSSAESQLRNGVITPSAYITELTNLFEDENALATHSIQLWLVKANYQVTKGN